MPPSVSCIIINYNGREFIQDCVDSLLGQTRPPEQVILVDNASQDGGAQWASSHYGKALETILLDENVGYAAACNRGVEVARGDLIAVLNNDIVLEPDWLDQLLCQVRPEWDFWASRIVFADSGLIDSAGDGMAVVGAAFKTGHGDPVSHHETLRPVFGPCGAAALYRRRLLERTGGFDPDFFLIYEDADLNARAQLLGFRCLYVPGAVVHHRVNTSIGTLSDTYVFYGHRNSEYVFWKNMPWPLLALYLPERILFNLLCFGYFLYRGKGWTFLRAKLAFLKTLPAVLRKRSRIQGQRKLSLRAFNQLLERNWLRYRRNVTKE